MYCMHGSIQESYLSEFFSKKIRFVLEFVVCLLISMAELAKITPSVMEVLLDLAISTSRL